MNLRTLVGRLIKRLGMAARLIRHPRRSLRRRKDLRRARRKRTLATERRRHAADYDAWFRNRFELAEQQRGELRCQLVKQAWLPRVSMLMATRKPNLDLLRQTVESVRNQIYPNWELWIADDGSTEPQTRALLRDVVARDGRIHTILQEETEDASVTLNAARKHCTGDYIGLLEQNDLLTEDAIYRVWQHLKENRGTRIVYSDEDRIDENGRLHEPHFKPDWSPEYFLSRNYLGHFTVVEAGVARQAGNFRDDLKGALGYDFLLRCLPQLSDPSAQIGHIPRILCHRRILVDSPAIGGTQRPATWDAGLQALRDCAARRGEPEFSVECGRFPDTYRVRWPLPASPPQVSLIIPTCDRHDLLSVCVDSILEKTDYPDYEILIVDNRSTCKTTLALLQQYRSNPRIRVVQYTKEFNFSAICNWAVRRQSGSITGLVNNDIEVINAEWMTEMVSQCCRTEIGCVGAKLRYGDNTIQHAGVILGLGGTAGHAHHSESAENAGYGARLATVNNYAAVTAACLFVRKCIYEEVGGMDEANLTIAFNDVDFCLKVLSAGYRNVFTPYAELYHYESQTRGLEDTRMKKRRFAKEAAFINQKWEKLVTHDPYYNPNLETDPPGKSFDLQSNRNL